MQPMKVNSWIRVYPCRKNTRSFLLDIDRYEFHFEGPRKTHYANMSVQYTANFKNGNFQMKNVIFFLFLIKT